MIKTQSFPPIWELGTRCQASGRKYETSRRQGDILILSPDRAQGTETEEGRPALLLSNAETNRQGRANSGEMQKSVFHQLGMQREAQQTEIFDLLLKEAQA